MFKSLLFVSVGLLVFQAGVAQEDPPNVLIVTAHPDDDAMFAATVYRITHGLGGTADLALVTDGSGGFRYSALAERIYGIDLTDERIARRHLPAIRKRELMAGGDIVGIRNYFFLDELDDVYTESIDTVLSRTWDAGRVKDRLEEIISVGQYDYVFVHLPIPNFHGHHKAATVLALEAAASLSDAQRPIVLGSFVGAQQDTSLSDFVEHAGYPITRVRPGGPHFLFDKTQAADETGRLNYHIVVNWVIAEHKSQGVMQLLMNSGDVERFWYFEVNPPGRFEAAVRLFDAINGR